MRWLLLILVLLPLALPQAAPADSIRVDATIDGEFGLILCSEGGASALCFLVEESGPWPGLGIVHLRELVIQSGLTDIELCEPQTRRGTLTNRFGSISYEAHGIDCPATRQLLWGYRAVVATWTVTGGTGRYAGATGTGSQNVRPEDEGDEVNTHYTGSIAVPGVAFDTVKPVFRGVRRLVTVRSSKAVAVRYAMPAAVDAVDGPLPVTCLPRSGARFPLGRTSVRCVALDSNGNEAAVSFTVQVRRR